MRSYQGSMTQMDITISHNDLKGDRIAIERCKMTTDYTLMCQSDTKI